MKLRSKSGYDIICDEYMQENSPLTVITMHGIGGSRKNSCIAKLQYGLL